MNAAMWIPGPESMMEMADGEAANGFIVVDDEDDSPLSDSTSSNHTWPLRSFGDDTMQDRIVRVSADEQDLLTFFNSRISAQRLHALRAFYQNELVELEAVWFEALDQEDRVDYLLLKNYLNRSARRLDLEEARIGEMKGLLSFAWDLVGLCESRQRLDDTAFHPKEISRIFYDARLKIEDIQRKIERGSLTSTKTTGYRATKAVADLRKHLAELATFFRGYDPMFDWWVGRDYADLDRTLQQFISFVQVKLAGMNPEDKDEIIGEPIGREGLLIELEAEMIPYTPEELIQIAREQQSWCETEMKKASRELGFGDSWRDALEHVKAQYVDPGQQPQFVKSLVDEGARYVKDHDLVTVPPLAEQTWRMSMMSPSDQKVNPFFLGGESIIVAYPNAFMAHDEKRMSMRGNNRHFSRAVAFHEMIPGHHLQGFAATRHRPYRRLFTTPFCVEGWAMHWEMVLWDRGDFFITPEDRVGTLFWRLHRCARIIFSLRFHLGEMTAQECVDLLVDMVGHERATAEGEVRRSLNGDYSPLYQAGYMLGALQLGALRTSVLARTSYSEKEFHDRVLRANEMPIEMMRALLLGKELVRDYQSRWRFYDTLKPCDTKR